jgi:hypothetical protein
MRIFTLVDCLFLCFFAFAAGCGIGAAACSISWQTEKDRARAYYQCFYCLWMSEEQTNKDEKDESDV